MTISFQMEYLLCFIGAFKEHIRIRLEYAVRIDLSTNQLPMKWSQHRRLILKRDLEHSTIFHYAHKHSSILHSNSRDSFSLNCFQIVILNNRFKAVWIIHLLRNLANIIRSTSKPNRVFIVSNRATTYDQKWLLKAKPCARTILASPITTIFEFTEFGH